MSHKGDSSSLLQGLFPTSVNVGEEAFSLNIKSAIKRDIPWMQQVEGNSIPAVLVAGGPSMKDHVGRIHALKQGGAKVFALNNTGNFLLDHGIVPDYQIILDARQSNARFVIASDSTTFLIASQCAPETFDAAGNTVLWHPNVEGISDYIGDRETALIGGGTTVGLQGMSIAYTLGHRVLHLFGYDSSYVGGEGHAYAQPENDGEPTVNVIFNNKRFVCARWMCIQVEEFKSVVEQLTDLDCTIAVHGEGFLQETFKESLKTPLTAVYDLSCSPASYDFISFLCEAEKARIAKGHSYIDITFMPGPINGFRDDDLPTTAEQRESMLQRICVPACRLLPSVRNVTVLKARQNIVGDIFPDNWSLLCPTNYYGTQYLKGGIRPLRATAIAKERTAINEPYITVTMRGAGYHADRNSNRDEWWKAADEIESMGYKVVFIEDTEKTLSSTSWDIDFRLAIYEGAVCNLMVSNGPVALVAASNCSYIVLKPITESCYSSSKEFLERVGMKEGDQYGDNGLVVWQEDTKENIINALSNYLENINGNRI